MRSIDTDDALCERSDVDADGLNEAIERVVEQATCGQIGGLNVVHLGDAIVLRGHCRTYHASRLAHEAVLDLIGDSARVVDLIIVR